MDLTRFIEDEADKFISAGKNIKDPRFFDIDFVPDSIYLRPEAEDLIEAIAFYIGSGLRPHLNIQGGKGAGKTVTTKYVLNTILRSQIKKGNIKESECKVFYVSCRDYPTSQKIYAYVTGEKWGDPFLVEKFVEEMNSYKYSFLILDEADFLRDHNIIFTTTRETRTFLITIAQNVNFFDSLDPATQSSFLPRHVSFRPYHPEELFIIMKDRAERGLYRYSLSIIEKMAREIAENHFGDARVAIRSLMYMGDNWMEDYIPFAIGKAAQSVIFDSVKKLRDRELALLSLIPPKEIKTAELFREFLKRFPRYNKMTKPTFFSMLNYLQAQGLILIMKGKGRAGSACQLIVDPLLVSKVIKERGAEMGGAYDEKEEALGEDERSS